MTDLATLDAIKLGGLYKDRRASPVEALEAVLSRLEACEPSINAFVHVDRDGARAAAAASEARYRAGEPLGPLDGVPISIKDLILTKGMPTRRGSLTTDPNAPQDTDAPTVARLRAGGAVLYGKATTTEFGGSPYSSSPLSGDTLSPWHLGYGVAGSSMGSAAHIAAGVGTLSVGNDAAGSVRMPASFGGVFGIKPTFGMVASYPPSSAGILGHTGPMGWGVAETALLLSVIAGPDPHDPFSLPRQLAVTSPDLEAGVSGMRIAYSPSLGIREPHRQVRASTDAAAKAFEGLGAHVEAVDPDFSGLIEAYDCIRIVNRAAAYQRSGAGARRSEMDELVARVIDQAAAYSTADYVAALAERDRLTVLMREFHETYDVLLTPTMAVLPLPIGTGPGPDDAHWYLIGGEIWSPYTFPFNMTHQPAASIPCGLTEADDTTPAGLPIGLQVVGGMHRDDLVLRACRAYETTRVWSRPACSFRGGAQ